MARMKALVKEAHRRIEAALPEGEPDCVPDWVCELLIELGQECVRESGAERVVSRARLASRVATLQLQALELATEKLDAQFELDRAIKLLRRALPMLSGAGAGVLAAEMIPLIGGSTVELTPNASLS